MYINVNAMAKAIKPIPITTIKNGDIYDEAISSPFFIILKSVAVKGVTLQFNIIPFVIPKPSQTTDIIKNTNLRLLNRKLKDRVNIIIKAL